MNAATSGEGSGMAGAPLESLLVAAGIESCWRARNPAAWRQASDAAAYLPVAYSDAMIDYQLAYFRGAGQSIQDLSLVLFHDRRPCGIWPLSLREGTEEPIGSNGAPILPPLFVRGLPRKAEKALTKACLMFLDSALGLLGGRGWSSVESFRDRADISEWQDQALQRGAAARLQHDLYVDLSLPIAEIKASFRKSYKSLITSGSRHWRTSLMDQENPAVWQEFRTLHCAVAGRVTRSAESWELQHQAVAGGHAFLVNLRDDGERMVGGGLFYLSADEGTYAVGAYDRSLFDKPLGHVVQYHAIEEMKRRGQHWYLIGARPYPADEPSPTAKELSIAEFKQGFATHIFPQYRVRMELK